MRFHSILTAACAVALALTSCESNFKEVQRINSVAFSPATEADSINLKYTDSGKVKAVLVSPKMLDFSNMEYAFSEFPKGVDVTLFDDGGQQTHVVSDYAINYAKTNIIDLRGHVTITTQDGKKMETEQLYYDQKNEWFYTEKYFKFTDGAGGYLEGPGIDFSKDFKYMNTQRSSGQVNNIN